ncbi:SDR family NAD(P)-dependent oxidoreductase [Nonomuraea soli]|uniref:NAD(P)-dependent dehydrogenase (Short-subunit alcohol dehydrogenase family) n=1 Tax=Nonomuraea soli TaxID=1032476 RepID=A0A7W0HWB9_9ACTN|nr:SDR family NAD(P)-dependent oxidoreductase [Nonomuraea soli]MBA2897937.1 NAD(P)-dependent dehydrogenase (short-subunit alcohol dehydrogenase family) [Nonomuraea soli]
MPKNVVISGGTSGMGRATALERLDRGDTVTVIGSSPSTLPSHPNLHTIQADLSSIAEVERVVTHLSRHYDAIDALALFANRPSPHRRETPDGLEYTFALYYLSRYLLSHRLAPLLDAAPHPVIVNVAGVGTTAGRIHWDDPQLTRGYGQIRAQLQAGRANDLLGVDFATRSSSKARYLLYHPGFTRSGVDNHPSPVVRASLKLLGKLFARPVTASAKPIVEWIDHPPPDPLTAIDRGKKLDLSLTTLAPTDAARLASYTESLLSRL